MTEPHYLRCYSPYGDDTQPGHPAQASYLDIDRSGQHTTRAHYVGGRGSGKTTVGILMALRAATQLMPGMPGLWTEPTYRLCHDVFFREWCKIVPRELWRWVASDQKIVLANGSEIDVRSRNVDNPAKEISKGPNYAWAIDDEAANKFDPDRYWDIDAAIRHPDAFHRFHDTLSTPQMNGYYHLCTSHKHPCINATSYDNPYLDETFAASLAEQLDPQRARQELYGEWVALSGRIWDTAVLDKQWPHGNIHPHTYDPNRPFFIGCDLGVQSAWLIMQRVPAWDQRHRTIADGLLDVVVAEYLPDDGDTQSTIRRIEADYGKPERVFVGADLNTRSIVDGSTSAYAFRQVWGGSVPVLPITGGLADKELQYQVAKARLLNALGERRFCISAGLRQYPERSPRGIRTMLTADQWPTGRDIRVGEALPKDKRTAGKAALEDVRDAWLYAMIGLHPPRWTQEKTHAA